MTNLRNARLQLEKAIVAYVMGLLPGTKWFAVPVHARMGEIDTITQKFKLTKLEEIPMPCIAVAVPGASRHDMGFAESEMHVIVLGSQDRQEEREPQFCDPLNDHAELAGFIAAAIADDQLATIMAAVNKPEFGPDTRKIKDFRMFGMIWKDETSQETDRAFIDDYVFKVHHQPTDDTSL